jgi:phosphoribosylanthranilate isomerase
MWNRRSTYTRIKLCWFEYLEAAYEASSIGADALGFHILQASTGDWRSKAEHFRSFLNILPAGIEKVLLIDYPFEVTEEVLAIAPFDCVQLYPDWEPGKVARLQATSAHRPKVLKVMSAQPQENSPTDAREFLMRYSDCADAILLDSFRQGGTGILADIDYCSMIVKMSPLPVFIAGGLDAANVAQRIRAIRPFGVDVESGISDRIPGGKMLKNLGKCREFIDAVVRADRELLRETSAAGLET